MNNNIVTSKDNRLVKLINKLYSDAKHRYNASLFVIESIRVIKTFISHGYSIQNYIVSENSKYKNEFIKLSNTTIVSQQLFQSISQLKHGDGLIAVVKMKKNNVNDFNQAIILDNIQDPGNLGSILRSMQAFNINKLFLLNSCVDVFNPKVIKASMGYGYNVAIDYVTDFKNLVNLLHQKGIKVVATALNPKAVNANKLNWSKTAVVFGNEGNGLKQNVLKYADTLAHIPINKQVDSLNLSISCGIIMHLMQYENS